MNIYQLKTAIASAFDKSVDDLMINDQDLGLLSLNQARQQAEQLNDFEFTRKLLVLEVDGATGGSLDEAVEYGLAFDSPPIAIKSVVDVGLFSTNNGLTPVEWTTMPDSTNRQREDNPYSVVRSPTDAQAVCGPFGQRRFVFSGDKVYYFPLTNNITFTMGIHAYTLSPDWVDADAEADAVGVGTWLLNGYNYLQWAAIVYMNQYIKGFVFRQEGNLPPPEKLRDEALNTLITWQAFKYEGYRRHDR